MFLRSQATTDAAAAQALARGEIDSASISAENHLLLEYAGKLTMTPGDMTDDDVRRLRDAGFSDEQIWEATFTTSIFAMFNRMADAFGLEPPDHMMAALAR